MCTSFFSGKYLTSRAAAMPENNKMLMMVLMPMSLWLNLESNTPGNGRVHQYYAIET
jgi:hypothetical protein